MINRLLIANRGEIACRIIRTAKRMGIQTIAVYSTADKQSLHTELADFSVEIGPAPAKDSYLNIAAIIKAATQFSANAIHPGYGFLSENPELRIACDNNGLIFIGPSTTAMSAMADKQQAKHLAQQAKVATIPGFYQSDAKLADYQAAALQIGYPVLVKAIAGGGGRGMRVVQSVEQLAEAIKLASAEANSAFDNPRIMLEKYLSQTRHIEVQILADQQGNIICIGDRDCSLQRRHQKVIEEAPAPKLPLSIRLEMQHAARSLCKAIGYYSLGTVEFLLTDDTFYFIEMNTRLQVEHPVTELVFGIDLVEWQLKVADGVTLPFEQQNIVANGHAIETRWYAESPEQDFTPQTGTIAHWYCATSNGKCESGVRVDHGLHCSQPVDTNISHNNVSGFYDAMLAKVVGFAETREQALNKLKSALLQCQLIGLDTNQAFLLNLLENPAFNQVQLSTSLIGELLQQTTAVAKADHQIAIAAMGYYLSLPQQAFRLNQRPSASFILQQANCEYLCQIEAVSQLEYQVSLLFIQTTDNNKQALTKHPDLFELNMLAVHTRQTGREAKQLSIEQLSVCQQGKPARSFNQVIKLNTSGAQIQLLYFDQNWQCSTYIANPKIEHKPIVEQTSNHLLAPMNAVVTDIMVRPNDEVSINTPLIEIEAMKMQSQLKAPISGKIKKVHCKKGQQVTHDQLLIEWFETEKPSE